MMYVLRVKNALTGIHSQNLKMVHIQAEEDTDESTSAPSNAAQSVMEDDGENESAPDLDASMEDLDEDATAETEDNDEIEGDIEDLEEEPSDAI